MKIKHFEEKLTRENWIKSKEHNTKHGGWREYLRENLMQTVYYNQRGTVYSIDISDYTTGEMIFNKIINKDIYYGTTQGIQQNRVTC